MRPPSPRSGGPPKWGPSEGRLSLRPVAGSPRRGESLPRGGRDVDELRGLPHLAADGLMPLWLAAEYGIPPRVGVVRFSWLQATAGAERKRRIYWLGWGPECLGWGPRLVRHGLLCAVGRSYLGVAPGDWDSLAIWAKRRLPRGHRWVANNRAALRRIPRPDAEWWQGGWSPVAVEVDTGKRGFDGPEGLRARVERWAGVYAGVVFLTPSEARAEALVWVFRDRHVRVVLLPRWWEAAEGREV